MQRTQELEQALSTVTANEQRTAAILEAAQDAFIGIDMRGRLTPPSTSRPKAMRRQFLACTRGAPIRSSHTCAAD